MTESFTLRSWDGPLLGATYFKPENSNGKVVLINSATGVKQQYYKDFAAYLASQGFHTYTFDYRGIGSSRPSNLRKVTSSMRDWAVDVDSLIGYIQSVHPQAKLVLLGHSVGGQLIGMSNLAKRADAFVMVCSQTPYYKNFRTGLARIKLIAFWFFMIPFFTRLAGYFPASKLGLFEDLPKNVALQWARWAKTPHYIFEEHPELRSNFESLHQRALVISFSDDDLAPHEAVLDLQDFYSTLKKEQLHITPESLLQKKISHFGFFRKRMESLLWQEIVRWINGNQIHYPQAQKNKAA